MPLSFVRGNIFDSGAEALVCPVNVCGAMGAGLAKQCRERWPGLLSPYREACFSGALAIGKVWTFPLPSAEPTGIKYVICLPTKADWRDPSLLTYVDTGLVALVDEVRYLDLSRIAIPALGCGYGGLAWGPVRETMIRRLAPAGNRTYEIYEPG